MKLPRKATIHNAAALASAMRQAIASGVPLSIDASEVEQIDTCVLQLLCAARKSVPEMSVRNPSASAVDAIRRGGLAHVFLTHLRMEAA